MPDARPEADPADVAQWCTAVETMNAEELGDFERQTRQTYRHHSLIELIVAIHYRRVHLERARWFRIKPSYQKPAGGFLAIGPLYSGEMLEDGAAVLFRWGSDGLWTECVPIEHVETNPEPRKPRNRWK